MADMKQGTSVQTGLAGLSKESAQSKAFEESNTAPGQGGSKPGLIATSASAKPLPGPGQLKLKPKRTRKPQIRIRETSEELSTREYELKEEIDTLERELTVNKARRLIPLITTHGAFKGEVHHLTPKQYEKFTGGPPRPSIIENGHVVWHLALDQLASEYGYKSDEDLKSGIEKAREDEVKLESLKRELGHTRISIRDKPMQAPVIERTRIHLDAPIFPDKPAQPAEVTEVNGLTLTARRNPSFWQLEQKGKPGAVRIHLKKSVDKVVSELAREHKASISIPNVKLPKVRLPKSTAPRRQSMTPGVYATRSGLYARWRLPGSKLIFRARGRR